MLRLCGLLILSATTACADSPLFKPVTIDPHIYSGGWEHYVGGGVAVFDCDGDQLPEVFAAGGETPTTLYRNTSKPQNGIALIADTPPNLRITGAIGAYPLDIDNDAITDLVVLRVGENQFMRGLGDCAFEPMKGLAFDTGARWTTAFSATWEQGQSLPTLAFGNYVDRENPDGPFEACDTNQMLRPSGDRYGLPIDLDPGFCPLSMLFSDWSRTGQADLRVSNDRHYYVKGGQEQMWALSPDIRLYDERDGWMDHQLWGMGIASRDISGDGLPEVMMTSMGDQRLQMRAEGGSGPTFIDAPFDLGATAHRPYVGGDGRPSTGWHVAFGDVQNDGRDDIFIAKGNVEQMPGLAMKDPNNLLVQTDDGTFVERGGQAGLDSLHRGRGASVVDLNADGLVDVVVVNRRAAMEVYQNVTTGAGHWLSLRVTQPQTNRDAIGAWVEVASGGKVMAREITVGGGHAGGQLGFAHFGLGGQTEAKVRVVWPDQKASDWVELPVDGSHILERVDDQLRVKN